MKAWMTGGVSIPSGLFYANIRWSMLLTGAYSTSWVPVRPIPADHFDLKRSGRSTKEKDLYQRAGKAEREMIS